MSVYKDNQRGTWYFHAHFRDNEGKYIQRKRRGFKRKKDAQIAERELIESYQRNHSTDLTFYELAKIYMDYSIGRKKEKTIYNQNALINNILVPYFADYKIKDIKPHHLVTFYQSLYKKYSNAYMKAIKRNLSAMLNYAVNFYDLNKNVAMVVELPQKEETKGMRFWTLEQFQSFLSVIDKQIYYTLFNVLFWSGMRKGEVLALQYQDIDFENNQIEIKSGWNGYKLTSVKNSSSERIISVPDHTIESIKALVKTQKQKFGYLKQKDFIFTLHTPDKPMSLTNVNKVLKEYTAKTDLPQIRVHHLRHSHASLLINNGVSLYIVSKHLGHSNIQTTANVYGHLYPNSEKEIGTMLNNVYQNAHERTL